MKKSSFLGGYTMRVRSDIVFKRANQGCDGQYSAIRKPAGVSIWTLRTTMGRRSTGGFHNRAIPLPHHFYITEWTIFNWAVRGSPRRRVQKTGALKRYCSAKAESILRDVNVAQILCPWKASTNRLTADGSHLESKCTFRAEKAACNCRRPLDHCIDYIFHCRVVLMEHYVLCVRVGDNVSKWPCKAEADGTELA